MKVTVWHNIMWSRYKAGVFSSLQTLCNERQVALAIYQIAETANERTSLSPVDLSWHHYRYELLFKGPYEAIPRLALFWKVAKITWFDDADISILAGYDRPEYWIQAAILLIRNKPFACFCDSTAYDNKQRLFSSVLKRIFFRAASGIFCYGQRAAEYVQMYGASQEKIIHRCQAAALYENYSAESALRERGQLRPRGTERFLYVGRLSQEKSIDHLILAFDRVHEKLTGSSLVLVGGGPEEARLKSLVRRLNLEDSVSFAGSKHGRDLFSEYLKATALVLPSFREPWGLVANEALSHCCPIVVSNRCGCVPELVDEGKTGYSFAWGDIDDLSRKLIDVATLDAQFTDQNCLRQIASFTPENAARSILDGAMLLASDGLLSAETSMKS